MRKMRTPIGISNRHIHLSKNDMEKLFGIGHELTVLKELSQPGEFACEEFVTIVGPKSSIQKVRIIGPLRKETQVEVSFSDAFALGVPPVVKISWDLEGTPGIKIVGPAGEVDIPRGVMVVKRHLHITKVQADEWGLKDEQSVSIKTQGPRGLTFDNVSVRVRDSYALDFHVDIEEANAAGLKNGDFGEIVL